MVGAAVADAAHGLRPETSLALEDVVVYRRWEGLQVAVRFLLDAGIARGLFTRDEYLRYVGDAQPR